MDVDAIHYPCRYLISISGSVLATEMLASMRRPFMLAEQSVILCLGLILDTNG